jgi:hypothetical protein
MPWNVIFTLLFVGILIAAIVIIKRRQDEPLRNFLEGLAFAKLTLKEKPQSITFMPAGQDREVNYEPAKAGQAFGNFKVTFEDLIFRFTHERTSEFLEFSGDEQARVGIQYIDGQPREVYIDDERMAQSRHFVDDHVTELLALRKSMRKVLKLKDVESV